MPKTKNKGGRPPKFASQADIAAQILLYTMDCGENRQMPNKAGLCIWLHISRDTYNEYKKKFPDAIKGAEAWIENAWVQRLAGNAPTGAIFYLKNAFKDEYKDRHETDITSGGEKLDVALPLSKVYGAHEDGGDPA